MTRCFYRRRCAAVLCCSTFIAGAAVISEIPLLPGERWWGGGGGDGQNQPYGAETSKRIDLRVHGNTSSPLLVSTAGRYVWSEQPFAYQFRDGKLVLDSDDARIQPVQAGKTLRDAYLAAARAHFRFAGAVPPEEFFTKPQWNNWIEIFLNGMDQKAADDYTAELAKSGFPCAIYMMDGGWMSHQGSYEFHAPDFPDPKGLFDRVNAQGWIPLVWTAHFVSPDSREYKRLRYHRKLGGLDYLATRGKPGSHDAAAIRWWSGISAIYDLTRPEANAFYVDTLLDFAAKYGIRGYKFDAGDPGFFREDCRFYDTSARPVDYTRLYAELAAREFPYHEIRVSWKCGGLPLVTRLGDRAHAWSRADMRPGEPDAWIYDKAQDTVIPQIVTAGLLGCPYSLADMVGGGLEVSFVGRPVDEKLFVRSAALQSLMPMMQFSALPWRHLSPAGVELCRQFAELHVRFAPYIFEQARRAAVSGEPIVRAMEYEFPHQGFDRAMQQFMLGPKWLVAPVLNSNDTAVVELPAGRWRDDLGEEHVGPKALKLEGVPLARLPRYERLDGALSVANGGEGVAAPGPGRTRRPLPPTGGVPGVWTTEGFHSSAGGKDATKFAWWMTDTALEFRFEAEDATPCAREKISGKMDVLDHDRVEVFLSPRVDMADWYYGAEMDPYGNVLDYRAKFFRVFDNDWSFRTLKIETDRRPGGYSLRGSISRKELVEIGIDPHNFSMGAFRGDFDAGTNVAWTSALPQPPGRPDFHRPAMLTRQILPVEAEELIFTGEQKEGVQVMAPSGAAQSFACWVKVEGRGKGDKPYDRIVQAPGWYFHVVAAPDDIGGLTFGYAGGDGSVVGNSLDGTLLFDAWQHVAVTYSASGFRIYLNGQAVGAPFAANLPSALKGGLACLGNSSVGGKRPLKGRILGARFWSRELGVDEVAGLVRTTPDGAPLRRPKSALPTDADLLPVVDVSDDAFRQTVIAEGAKDRYEGHPTTLIADDGRTMFCVWTTGHGGPCGQMARSEDGGRTWTRVDSILPSVYGRTHRNCPVLQKVRGPDGKVRYFIYSAKAKEGSGLGIMMSEDRGATWTELPCQPQLSAGMPPTGLMELRDGTVALFGQVRKNPAVKSDRPTDDQNVWMAISRDGGRSYGEMRTVMASDRRNLCEPCCLRSPDGKSLVLLARENRHRGRSMMSFSSDEGKTWTEPVDTPWALTGDRHEGVLLPDGRFVIAFRDQAVGSPTRGQFMAWVGTFDDLRNGRPGQCRIHLLRHHFLPRGFPGGKGDTGYPGVELLPDGTIVCTTYTRHFDDDRQSSVVCTRFKIAEIDERMK